MKRVFNFAAAAAGLFLGCEAVWLAVTGEPLPGGGPYKVCIAAMFFAGSAMSLRDAIVPKAD